MSVAAEFTGGGVASNLSAGEGPDGISHPGACPILSALLACAAQADGAGTDLNLNNEIASGASSSRSAGDDCRGAAGNPHAVQPPPAPRADLVSIHITADTANLLAVLAAEHRESLGGMVARLAVAEIQSKGGIARV